VGPIMVVTEHTGHRLTDASWELIGKAKELARALDTRVMAVGFGGAATTLLGETGVDEAVALTGADADAYRPVAYEAALSGLIHEASPALVLMPSTTLGMDLGASLAARHGVSCVAYVVALAAESGAVTAESQVYGGKLRAQVEVPVTGTIVTVLPGSWAAVPQPAPTGQVTERPLAPDAFQLVDVMEPESGGDVDITRADVLVSVGRGIQGPENLDLAEELAAALGGVVSCSRPVVDAGWLPRSRQVGKSGQTVKPKVYLAFGISGAPEHLQGMKDAELIVAVNSDPSAPIFEVAHYGATVDILELMPALSERVREGA
jgi:electron transfer flavoprotein alpha subunit